MKFSEIGNFYAAASLYLPDNNAFYGSFDRLFDRCQCELDISDTNEPSSLQIGTGSPRRKGMK